MLNACRLNIAVGSHCDDFDDDLLSSLQSANLAFYEFSWGRKSRRVDLNCCFVVDVVDVVADHVELAFDVSNVMR